MNEIRVHGRGGQGVVMAVRILASALVLEGKYAASFPMFGSERRGAPVTAFLRIDEKHIREKTQIYEPNCLVVVDPNLIKTQDIFDGLKLSGTLVINATRVAKELYSPNVGVVGFVDATRIGLEEIGIPVTNTCMMGAFTRATGWVQLDSILQTLRDNFSGALLERNIKCVRRGFDETIVLKI
ncbi:NADH-dependent phenylglyoxylate dehydrogenase subunit gamma [subsurface metagenome]